MPFKVLRGGDGTGVFDALGTGGIEIGGVFDVAVAVEGEFEEVFAAGVHGTVDG